MTHQVEKKVVSSGCPRSDGVLKIGVGGIRIHIRITVVIEIQVRIRRQIVDGVPAVPLVGQGPVGVTGAHLSGVPQGVGGIGPAAGHDNGFSDGGRTGGSKHLNPVIDGIGYVDPAVTSHRHILWPFQLTGIRTGRSDGFNKHTIGGKLLKPVVTGIRHPYIAGTVNRHPSGIIEFSAPRAGSSPLV